MVAILADKDVSSTAAEFANCFNSVIVTQAPGPRALPADEFEGALLDSGIEVLATIPNAIAAYDALVKKITGTEAVGVVSGSLYLVGEVLGSLREVDEDE
jgi:dihydrofolate synthase/folylpolyglutamate synthase